MSQGGEAACRPGVGVHRGGGGSPAEPSTATKTKRSKHFLSARFRRCPASFCHVAGSTHCLVSGLPKKKVQSSCQLQPPTLEELTTAPSVCLLHSAPPPPRPTGPPPRREPAPAGTVAQEAAPRAPRGAARPEARGAVCDGARPGAAAPATPAGPLSPPGAACRPRLWRGWSTAAALTTCNDDKCVGPESRSFCECPGWGRWTVGSLSDMWPSVTLARAHLWGCARGPWTHFF